MRIGLVGAGRIGARHAATLCELPRVEALVVADTQAGRARELAARIGAEAVDTVEELFAAGLDGLVVAAATDAHAELVIRGVAAGLPVFCEKPIAPDIRGTFQVIQAVNTAGVPVQVGFQRRFDSGHVAARDAVASGRLGWLHTVRSCTLDPAPPPRDYIPISGGLFRDCAVHDFDAVRFVTGREVVQAVAAGANRGDEIFSQCDDVDTATAVLTLDDGTIAVVSATRYNAAGYDVRFEALGSKESVVAGLDSHTPLTPVEGGACATPYGGFLDRFADAYDAELRAFTEVVAGRIESPCRPEEALEAFYVAEACDISRHEGRVVELAEVRR
jgi:myo-inositol 2-dehydrogenase/D-chiro-inositol 1-dehydrogenase